jgi:aerobic C4-dicarboxylate transport protein
LPAKAIREAAPARDVTSLSQQQPVPLYKRLYFQVLLGIVLGILVGHFFPAAGVAVKPLGDAFIKLIRMLVAPVIFLVVAIGIGKMGDLKEIGRVGAKALVYFEGVTTLALLIGLLVANLIKPGAGMNVDPKTLDMTGVSGFATTARSHGAVDFLMRIIPDTVVEAFAKGDILPVVFFSVLFGVAVSHFSHLTRGLVEIMEQTSTAIFGIVGYVMKMAPLGAFGAVAFTIGRYGIGTLYSLAFLMAAFYITCVVFIFVVLGAISRACGFSIWKLISYIKEESLIVLGTSTQEAVLPRMLLKLERLGCKKSVVGLVIPTGYAFNLDGVCIYSTMSVLFIGYATNAHLTLLDQLTILGVLILTTKGMSGVPGGGFIAVAATLSSVQSLPVAGLALLLGVDRFMSEARAVTSLIGNAVATVVVAKWDGALDEAAMRRVLNNETVLEADNPEELVAAGAQPVSSQMP